MSLDFLKDELKAVFESLVDDLEDEYREEAEKFLKQAAEDFATQGWKAKTGTPDEREMALALIEDVKISAELLAAELYLEVADQVDKRYQEIRDRLKMAVRVAAGVLKSTIKFLGPLLV